MSLSCPVGRMREWHGADWLALVAACLAAAPVALLVGGGAFSIWDEGMPLAILPPALLVAPILIRSSGIARGVAWTVALLLVAFSVLAALTIGVFYMPAALVALASAARR